MSLFSCNVIFTWNGCTCMFLEVFLLCVSLWISSKISWTSLSMGLCMWLRFHLHVKSLWRPFRAWSQASKAWFVFGALTKAITTYRLNLILHSKFSMYLIKVLKFCWMFYVISFLYLELYTWFLFNFFILCGMKWINSLLAQYYGSIATMINL